MVADPRAAAYRAWMEAMRDKAAATAALHEAETAIVEYEALIATHLSDTDCWVYGDVALVRDPITHRVISKRVVRLEG